MSKAQPEIIHEVSAKLTVSNDIEEEKSFVSKSSFLSSLTSNKFLLQNEHKKGMFQTETRGQKSRNLATTLVYPQK